MSFYLKVILFFRRLGIGKPIAEGNYREILRAWKFGSVIVGDLIEIDNQIRLFAGMNKNGAPGQVHYAMIGMPSPEFIPATPFLLRKEHGYHSTSNLFLTGKS